MAAHSRERFLVSTELGERGGDVILELRLAGINVAARW